MKHWSEEVGDESRGEEIKQKLTQNLGKKT